MVLATQNPVDLDYKAMSNAGTWLVGRLQTENDKARVLEGLRSAAGGTDVAALDAAIGGLGEAAVPARVGQARQPRIFATRWAMSYLRGPLTKEQVATLMARDRAVARAAAAAPRAGRAGTGSRRSAARRRERPVAPAVASGVAVTYLDPAAPWASQVGATAGGRACGRSWPRESHLRYDDTTAGIDEEQEFEALYGPLDGGLDLDQETVVDYDDRDLAAQPPAGATYVLPAAPVGRGVVLQATAETDIKRRLVDEARRSRSSANKELKLTSRPGETTEDFTRAATRRRRTRPTRKRPRSSDAARGEAGPAAIGVEQAQRRVEELDVETNARASERARRRRRRRARRDLRRPAKRTLDLEHDQRGRLAPRHDDTRGRAAQDGRGAGHREEDDLQQLEQELLDKVSDIDGAWREKADAVEGASIRLEATDVHVAQLALVWVPTT